MPEERLEVIQMLRRMRAKDLSLHLRESVYNVLRNAASVSKGDPLRPKVAGDPVRSYWYLGEDTLEELAGTMTPPPLRL